MKPIKESGFQPGGYVNGPSHCYCKYNPDANYGPVFIDHPSVFSVSSVVKRCWRKLKTRISNIWRKRVTSNPEYALIKNRLKMLRKVLSRNNGVVLFDVIINKDGNYEYKIFSSNLLTDWEMSQAHGFIWKVLHDRVQQETLKAKAASIINEANNILNAD